MDVLRNDRRQRGEPADRYRTNIDAADGNAARERLLKPHHRSLNWSFPRLRPIVAESDLLEADFASRPAGSARRSSGAHELLANGGWRRRSSSVQHKALKMIEVEEGMFARERSGPAYGRPSHRDMDVHVPGRRQLEAMPP
jgi:hypothetical protein